jgi:hypothetical protein
VSLLHRQLYSVLVVVGVGVLLLLLLLRMASVQGTTTITPFPCCRCCRPTLLLRWQPLTLLVVDPTPSCHIHTSTCWRNSCCCCCAIVRVGAAVVVVMPPLLLAYWLCQQSSSTLTQLSTRLDLLWRQWRKYSCWRWCCYC